MRRRGIVLPRLYLMVVLAALFGMIAALFFGPLRAFVATVVLHDLFPACLLVTLGPLFLCDPARGRTPFWAAVHLVSLSAAGFLSFFFLSFCDLLARDDRAFLTLFGGFVAVLVGRLYVADLVIGVATKGAVISRRGRRALLSAYARMLDVDHGRVGLPAPGIAATLGLSIRSRVLRVLGLRLTRSHALEEAFRKVADRLAARLDADPSGEVLAGYASAVAAELQLHRIVLAFGGGQSSDIAERWPSGFIVRWTVLMRGYHRRYSRCKGGDEMAELLDFRERVMLPLIGSARDVMRVVHASDNPGDKGLADAVTAFSMEGRVAAFTLRSEFDRQVVLLRRGAASPKSVLAFMVLAHAAAEATPSDFIAVYGDEKSGGDEWTKTGLPSLLRAIYLVVAARRVLESGGLSESQSGPAFARLLRASAFAGFSSADYPERAWGHLMRSASLQWENFARGLKPDLVKFPPLNSSPDDPGIGRISLANAFALAALAATVAFFTFSSPTWIPKNKQFRELSAPHGRTTGTARSIDLSSDGDRVAVATAEQGLLTVDVRNYGVDRVGVGQGLSSNALADVVALSGRAFAVTTKGPHGAQGLDLVKNGAGSPIIGLSPEDHSVLTSKAPLTMVNVGKDAFFVFRNGLVRYDPGARALVKVANAPQDIKGACGNRLVDGKAWLLAVVSGRNVVKEIVREGGSFGFKDGPSDPQVNPSKIFHDGDSLWCLDQERASVFVGDGLTWKLRVGSPSVAKESGGLAAADKLAVSRRRPPADKDALWMLKSGRIFVRGIPHDSLQAELPEPWVEAPALEPGYLGEVHGFTLDDVAYLAVPYADGIRLFTHRESSGVSASWVRLPSAETRLRSLDVGANAIAIASADRSRSQVHLMDLPTFCGLAAGRERSAWPEPVQKSAFLSGSFKLDDVIGVFQNGPLTYHFDSTGRLLVHDSVRHGLVNPGDTMALGAPDYLQERLKSVKVRSVSQSGDGAKAIVATNFGLHEVAPPLNDDGRAHVNTLFFEPFRLPKLESSPFGVSETRYGPEVYFSLPPNSVGADGARKLAQAWRLKDHLALKSEWELLAAGPGSDAIFADTLMRVRIDRPEGGLFYGAPVALNDKRKLVVRDSSDDNWKESSVDGLWTDIANASGGGTALRQLSPDAKGSRVVRISQLVPAGDMVAEKPLWTTPASVPKGDLINPAAVVPVHGVGMVFPTNEGFWSYQPYSRSWTRLMGHAPGEVANFRILSEGIKHDSGASLIAWWEDDSSNVFGVDAARSASFASVGRLSDGVASADKFIGLTDKNGLYSFCLGDGSARKLFAPTAPAGPAGAISAVEQSERGIAFLPDGGGRVLTLDADDQFVAEKGPVMKSIATVAGRLVGISEIQGDTRLAAVFSPGTPLGSGLVEMRTLGDVLVARSAADVVWMAGFGEAGLRGFVLGNAAVEGVTKGELKVGAAAHFDGHLFVSTDSGVYCRADAVAPEEIPGLRRLSANSAEWFRSLRGLGKVAPAGGLGCFSISDKVVFSLIARSGNGEFSFNYGLDVPILGPGEGPGSFFKLGNGGKVVPYDDAHRQVFGGATCLGKDARVHPLDAGLLVLTRSLDGRIAHYDPARGGEVQLGYVHANGTRVGSPFGPSVDFVYASESPSSLPFLREGPILGRLSGNHADIEILSERAVSPVVQSGILRWIEGGQLMGASALGGYQVTKASLPDVSSSSTPSVVASVLLSDAGDRLFALADGVLVDVDLKADKFHKVKKADQIFPLPGGVVVATRADKERWEFSDGTTAVPEGLKGLGQAWLGYSDKYLAAYVPFSEGGFLKVRAASISRPGDAMSYTSMVAPRGKLTLGHGSSVQLGRRLLHVQEEKLFIYDIDRGEWSEPALPIGFRASSLRRHRDGNTYVVDDETADAIRLNDGAAPLGGVSRGLAYGLASNGELIKPRFGKDGRISLRAGEREVGSELDVWKRHGVAFTRRALSYNCPGRDITLLADSPSTAKASLYVKGPDGLVAHELELPAPFSQLTVYSKGDGFIVTDYDKFIRHINVAPDGMATMFDEPFDYFFPESPIAPSIAPGGWVKVAGVFLHESGYADGMVLQTDRPIRRQGGRVLLAVRKVVANGESELVEEIAIGCEEAVRWSVVHPDFGGISAADSAKLEDGWFFADFDGKRVRLLPRRVGNESPAPVDEVSQLAVIGSSALCYIDGQGGMWSRDTVSGLRRFLREVPPGARFIYSRSGDERDPDVVLEAGGKYFAVASDARLRPVEEAGRDFAATLSGFGRRVGRLQARAGARGFSFSVAGQLPIGVTPDGWMVGDGAAQMGLRLAADGELMLEFSTNRAGAATLMHVPAVGERRFLGARLMLSRDFKPEQRIAEVGVGGYSFSIASGELVVSHRDVRRPIAFLPAGGIEPDHYSKAISIAVAGRRYLVNASGVTGRIYLRSWESGGLGAVQEVDVAPFAGEPSIVVTVDDAGFLKYAAGWCRLQVEDGRARLLPLDASPVASWGELARNPSHPWTMEGGKVYAGFASGREEVPCSGNPASFAFDRPSRSLSDYRSLGDGRILFRSSVAEGVRPLWYALSKKGAIPQRFQGAVPDPYVEQVKYQRADSLGNQMLFTKDNLNEYSLTVKGASIAKIPLVASSGRRLPHLGELTKPIAARGGVSLEAGRCSNQRPLFVFIPDDGAPPSISLEPPRVDVASQSSGKSLWWIKAGEVCLSWSPSDGLDLGKKRADGATSFLKLGTYSNGRPLDVDDPGQVVLRDVRAQKVVFSLKSSPEKTVTLSSSDLGSLACVVSMDFVAKGGPSGDIFAEKAEFPHDEMRLVDASTGRLRIDGFSSKLIPGPRIAVGPGLELPLHKVDALGGWTTPQGDAVAGLRLPDGRLLLQSAGGAWLSFYSAVGRLVACKSVESSEGCLLRWAGPGREIPCLEGLTGGVSLSLPSLEEGPRVPGGESFAIEAGLSASRAGAVPFGMKLGGRPVDPIIYPSVDISGVSLAGDALTLSDSYGIRTLASGSMTEVSKGELPRIPFGSTKSPKTGAVQMACGAWSISSIGGKHQANMGGRSLLDAGGVPFVDRISDFDGFEKHTVHVHEERVVVSAHSMVVGTIPWGQGEECIDRSKVAAPRLGLSLKVPKMMVDFGSGCGKSYDVEKRTLRDIQPCRRPLGGLSRSQVDFAHNEEGAFEMQITLSKDDVGPASVRYLGKDVFFGNQLVADHVGGLRAEKGAFYVLHPPSVDEPKGWQECIPERHGFPLRPLRSRRGPELSVGVPSALAHPWSESRSWGIEGGALMWTETGERWGY